jgi:hypothetical protein
MQCQMVEILFYCIAKDVEGKSYVLFEGTMKAFVFKALETPRKTLVRIVDVGIEICTRYFPHMKQQRVIHSTLTCGFLH